MERNSFRVILAVGLVVGIIAGSVFAPVIAQGVASFLNPDVPVDGEIPVGHPDGATVFTNTNSEEMDLSNFTASDRLYISTSTGNVSVYSNGNTEMDVYPGQNLTGTWTNLTDITAGSTWIEAYPVDKQRVNVRGDVNELSIADMATDDGVADLYYSGTDGGLVSVEIYDLPANTQIAATDANTNEILDLATSDSNGNISYDLPASSHTVELETSDGAPILKNPSPTGQITDPPDFLSIDMSDPDMPDDAVNVSISFEGTQVYSETDITQNKTVNTNNFTANELGKVYDWSVTATDAYGQTTTENYSFELPGFLYVYQESNPSELVDNVSVNATVTGSGETVDLDTVGDGTINMSGLPADESYVFTLTADNYHPREVYIENLFEQQTVFMLNTSIASVQNQITITDRTGEYDEGTVILVDRVINTSVVANMTDNGPQWVTIGGDRLGAGGFYSVDLEEDARYRFRVTSEVTGSTRILSEYTAKQSGEINLQIGSIRYSIGDENTYEWDVSDTNESTGHSIRFAYNDHENLTSNVSVDILTRENRTVVDSQDFTTGPYGEVVFTTTVSDAEWENTTYVVEWSATRDGEVISGSRIIGGKATLDLPLANVWKSILYAGSILVLAFIVGAGAGVAPALITIGMAGGFAVYIGLAPPALGFGSTILVIALGTIYMIGQSQQV